MNLGSLVRYSPFPHEEFHKSGMTGLVVSDPYTERATRDLHLIDVMWSEDRPQNKRYSNTTWEYIDELEVINGV